MSFFISDAMANAAPIAGEAAPAWTGILPMVILFVVFYFLLIRPQQKKAKEHSNMVKEIAKGDEVVTNGGILGKIRKVDENFVDLEVSKDVTLTIQKHQISQLMPKGTLKSHS
ncbi:MAG: preprotein translocase subunit YajC [Gammaproteobacteria bacterium]|jgi:preprotein translocase subunit YajC|nr:preprotein translocase subunit YajC [Gammaproteobacteria bacterium]MBT4605647.1 preprotein translocase subunit YajC [Thiotrichales bacterium]MBT3473439.1 preprotein translocase subunit YajC [Gammaproteobacteria bacterium]MBT3968061.1 preprotein translocase subunit YajC [Gammaproteobacteria bacterium]MBT4079127.1 preprotein translocase subunit YajC [Gammaproteobacteria bacterium]